MCAGGDLFGVVQVLAKDDLDRGPGSLLGSSDAKGYGSESSVMPMSDQLHRPVVVAMIAMRVMEPSVHQVINMTTVRDGFVSAVRTMLMA
jgi:hypothetical protein